MTAPEDPRSRAAAAPLRPHGIAVVSEVGRKRSPLQRLLACVAVGVFGGITGGFAVLDRLHPPGRHAELRTLVATRAAALAPDLEAGWLELSPPARPRLPVPAALAGRNLPGQLLMFWCEVNEPVLRSLWPTTRPMLLAAGADAPTEFAVFTMPDGGLYPRFRYPPSTTFPDGLTTNNFGFRSADLTLAKPPRTVRIACVGASAMVDPHDLPWSGPELLQHWLEQWATARNLGVRFEVLNAGREAITSADVRAIVEHELPPFGIDYVVFYEGANQCGLQDLLRHVEVEGPFTAGEPPAAVPTDLDGLAAQLPGGLGQLRRWSVEGRRLFDALGFGTNRPEPPKPAQRIVLPPGIDERAPDPARAGELLQLGAILRDLDGMLATCQRHRAQLVVCSFCWCVAEGMRLDLGEWHSIWSHLNQHYWPLSYATIRQLTDLQNRGFAAWARLRGVPFVDLAAQLPRDPRLFTDAVHASALGSRLRTWLLFAALTQRLDADLKRGAVPVSQPNPPSQHPVLGHARRLTAAELDGR